MREAQARRSRVPLYTAEERVRRDTSPWTLVQGVLAPVQFVVFLASLALVVRVLATGEGAFAATVSVVIKTLVLYAIMVTGSIWERAVFGRWLFARAICWNAPYFATIRPRFLELRPGLCQVSMPKRRRSARRPTVPRALWSVACSRNPASRGTFPWLPE